MPVYIESVELEDFLVLHQSSPLLVSYHVSRQKLFHLFLYYYTKQDTATTAAPSKTFIELL